jgi:hypothetical protein
MLPGISAEDCLFADLGLDPGVLGCQSHEATSFVAYHRQVDPACALILWQVGAFGNAVYRTAGYDLSTLPLLVEYLETFYPATHEVCVYEAALFPNCQARIDWVPLRRLAEVPLGPASTLFVPPAAASTCDPEILQRLRWPLPEA